MCINGLIANCLYWHGYACSLMFKEPKELILETMMAIAHPIDNVKQIFLSQGRHDIINTKKIQLKERTCSGGSVADGNLAEARMGKLEDAEMDR